jgi:hypothetical protein
LKAYVNYNPTTKTSTIVNVLEEKVEYEPIKNPDEDTDSQIVEVVENKVFVVE